jgi:hypothetical protein
VTTSAPTTAATSAPVDGGCLGVREEVLAPVLPRSEDKTIQERRRHPRGVRRLVRPPSTASGAGEAVDVADSRTARPSPVRWTDSHAPTKRQEAASEAAPGPSEPGTRQLTALATGQPRVVEVCLLRKAGEHLLPRMLEEEAGHRPMRKVGPRLGSPPTPARMMNILEAEGRREAAAQLASPHHKAGSHPSG